MKIKIYPFICIFICTIFFYSIPHQVNGQEKVNVLAGFGVPELLFAAVRLQSGQTQFGMGYGSIPDPNNKIFTLSWDLLYHFGGQSKFSDRRPGYFRLSLYYYREEKTSLIYKDIYLSPRIGRDFNFSQKFGMAIDIGVAFMISEQVIYKTATASLFEIDFPVLPSFGLGFYYRINASNSENGKIPENNKI
jgi:hypothetical protein